jgi:hypothetical protein
MAKDYGDKVTGCTVLSIEEAGNQKYFIIFFG